MLFGPAKSVIVTSRRRPSLFSTNTHLWFSMKLFLILGIILGTYPQAGSACPTHPAEVVRGDVWQSQRTHAHSSSLDLQPESTQLVSHSPISLSLTYCAMCGCVCTCPSLLLQHSSSQRVPYRTKGQYSPVFPGLPRKVWGCVFVLYRDHIVFINKH
jgi:hypothetical protein